MRHRLVFFPFVFAFAAMAYVASPLWAAWSIREAVKTGDHAYLQHAIDWPRVRTTLSQSLIEDPLQATGTSGAVPSSSPARRGLWQRFKGWMGRSMVDSFVARNITPEGLPRLFGIGKTYRAYVHGDKEPERTLATLPHRVAAFWARVKRAEFLSLTNFEIDFLDKYNPTRLYVGTLELTPKGWRLVGLRIKPAGMAVPKVQPATRAL